MDALNNTTPGDYIKKPMMECTGKEICQEWLYHIGVPEDQIEDLAENHANIVPCVMPYVTSYFEVRARGDRPKIVPDGAVNFGFMGEFVEIPRDVVFTTEYAVRSAMEAVYTLLKSIAACRRSTAPCTTSAYCSSRCPRARALPRCPRVRPSRSARSRTSAGRTPPPWRITRRAA